MSARNRDIVCECVCPPISFSLPPSSLLSLSLSLCIHPSGLSHPQQACQQRWMYVHTHTRTYTHAQTHTRLPCRSPRVMHCGTQILTRSHTHTHTHCLPTNLFYTHTLYTH